MNPDEKAIQEIVDQWRKLQERAAVRAEEVLAKMRERKGRQP